MQFIKDLVKPVDPSYVRWIKGSDNVLSEFSGKNATFDGGGSLAGSIVSNSTTPLKDIRDYKYTSVITSNGDYFGYVFDVPSSLRGNTSVFEFLFKANANTKFNIVAKDVTNASIIQSTTIATQNGTSPQYQFVFTIPATCTQVKIGWQYTGSVAGDTFEWDNVIFKLWTPQTANLVEQENWKITQANNTLTNISGEIQFSSSATTQKNGAASSMADLIANTSGLIYAVNTGDPTKFYAAKKCVVNVFWQTWMALGGERSQVYKNGVLYQDGNYPINGGLSSSVGASIALSAGDYFSIGTTASVNNNADVSRLSFTASAISENIIQSWQDGTEWKALTYTEVNALSGNQGFGTFTAGGYEYKRDGSDLLIKGKLTAGPVTTSEARIPLPNGLVSSDTTRIPSLQIAGTNIISGTGAVSQYVLIEPSVSYMTFGQQYASGGGLAKRTGSDLIGTGVQISFTARIPIQGWSSSPTLIALPTSKENVFSANINADASISSQNATWLSGVVKNSTGYYTVTFKSGTFTVSPSLKVTGLGASGIIATVSAYSASSFEVYTRNSSGTLTDIAFSIEAQKQSPDYTPQGVFVGNVQPDWQYDLTVTGTNFTQVRAKGIVYKTGDGTYKLRFNFAGTISSVSQTGQALNISGVTFKNITNNNQAVSGVVFGGGANSCVAYTGVNDSSINFGHPSYTVTKYSASGDVELESKPSWATMTN